MLAAIASDFIHQPDDRMEVHITIRAAGSGNAVPTDVIWCIVESDFWDSPRVTERFLCRVGGDLDDLDALVVAAHDRLAVQLRDYGTDYASSTYFSHTALLDEVSPAIAARLDNHFRQLLGIAAEEGTTTAVRLNHGPTDTSDRSRK